VLSAYNNRSRSVDMTIVSRRSMTSPDRLGSWWLGKAAWVFPNKTRCLSIR